MGPLSSTQAIIISSSALYRYTTYESTYTMEKHNQYKMEGLEIPCLAAIHWVDLYRK